MSGQPMIDFKKLKELVSIMAIADHYEFELRETSSQWIGPCPFCSEDNPSPKDRHHNSTCFKITPSINAWKCFSCDEHGNVLDLVALMEDTNLRNASLLIAKWFDLEDCHLDSKSKNSKKVKAPKGKPTSDVKSKPSEDVVEEGKDFNVNKPLGWAGLKDLDAFHPEILDADLKPEILTEHDAGVCSAGMMKGRLAVPFKNMSGEVLGYCGISLSGEKPEYKWPASDKFNPGLELFGLWNVVEALERDDSCSVVSILPNVLQVLGLDGQKVYPNLMGRTQEGFTDHQVHLLMYFLGMEIARPLEIHIYVFEEERVNCFPPNSCNYKQRVF